MKLELTYEEATHIMELAEDLPKRFREVYENNKAKNRIPDEITIMEKLS